MMLNYHSQALLRSLNWLTFNLGPQVFTFDQYLTQAVEKEREAVLLTTSHGFVNLAMETKLLISPSLDFIFLLCFSDSCKNLPRKKHVSITRANNVKGKIIAYLLC